MADATPRGNLNYFPSYSHPRNQLISHSEELSGLSPNNLQAGFGTESSSLSPESPSSPLLTNAYQLPASHDWLNWDKAPLSPEIDGLFPKVEHVAAPIMPHLGIKLAVNPVELSHHSMAKIVDYGEEGLGKATQLFDSVTPKQSSAQQRPNKPKTSASYAVRSPSTTPTTASEETRHHSRKRKSSSSSSAKSSPRSSVSPGPSSGSTSSSSVASGRQRSMPTMPPKKTAHNMIEKRYRTNLNDKIAALRDSVPSLRVMVQRLEQQSSEDGDEEIEVEDLGGLVPAHKLNKATILNKATEYITHLERRNKNLAKENAALRRRMERFQMMVEKAQVWDEEDAEAPR